jgi:hypothetical protein
LLPTIIYDLETFPQPIALIRFPAIVLNRTSALGAADCMITAMSGGSLVTGEEAVAKVGNNFVFLRKALCGLRMCM